jgi:hypothetical protein
MQAVRPVPLKKEVISMSSIKKLYPSIAQWVEKHGCIEIGQNGSSDSFVRAMYKDIIVWEDKGDYATLEDALKALDSALEKLIKIKQ